MYVIEVLKNSNTNTQVKFTMIIMGYIFMNT